MSVNPLKQAILLTGAAARISQEVAIIDKLRELKGVQISQKDTLLAGYSSGSLNIAAINACFSEGSNLDWDTYFKNEVLFQIRNKDVFSYGIPLDTEPLRARLTTFCETMNCKVLGDLPFYSFIMSFSNKIRNTIWACSRDKNQRNISLVDMLMASTAIPIVFPAQTISYKPDSPRDLPDGKYSDGGTQGTFINFEKYIGEYVIQNGSFETMYVISPMRDKISKIQQMVDSLPRFESLVKTDADKIFKHFENISLKTFFNFLTELNDWRHNDKPIAKNIFVCIPQMKKNFNIMNFDNQEEQYYAVIKWVENNPEKLAMPVDEYLKMLRNIIF